MLQTFKRLVSALEYIIPTYVFLTLTQTSLRQTLPNEGVHGTPKVFAGERGIKRTRRYEMIDFREA